MEPLQKHESIIEFNNNNSARNDDDKDGSKDEINSVLHYNHVDGEDN